jgi:DNA-binding MarR family transcriptional regulator
MNLNGSVAHQLRVAEQAALKVIAQSQGGTELTRTQFAFLETVSKFAPCTQQRIGEITGCDRTTVASVGKRLAKSGFIKRRRRPHDGRCYDITLLPAGVAAVEATRPTYEKIDRSILAALPADRQETFVETLLLIIGSAVARSDD